MPITIAANMPTVTVEAYLNGSWRDISAYLITLDTDLGREWENEEYNGSFTLTLRNTDARFTRANTTGPYASAGVSWIDAFTPIRVRSTWAATTYDLHYGFADDWIDSYPASGKNAITTVPCQGTWSALAAYTPGTPSAAVGEGELSGDRISRLATSAGWALGTSFDAGLTPLQATTLEQNVWQEMQLVARSEGGVVYTDKDGGLVFEDRASLVTKTRSTVSQVTFGNNVSGGQVPFSDPVPTTSGRMVVNQLDYARVGGVTQSVSDATSITRYRARRKPQTDLVSQTDTDVLAVAELDLARFKDAEDRFRQLTIDPIVFPAVAWPHALARRIRDRCTIATTIPVSGLSSTKTAFIEGIRHTINVLDCSWLTTFSFSSTTAYDGFSASVFDTGVFDTALFFF
jgi:hypothetical protein